jgi:hypothetical protein
MRARSGLSKSWRHWDSCARFGAARLWSGQRSISGSMNLHDRLMIEDFRGEGGRQTIDKDQRSTIAPRYEPASGRLADRAGYGTEMLACADYRLLTGDPAVRRHGGPRTMMIGTMSTLWPDELFPPYRHPHRPRSSRKRSIRCIRSCRIVTMPISPFDSLRQ